MWTKGIEMERHNPIVRSAGSNTNVDLAHVATAETTAHRKTELDGTWIAQDATVAGVRAPQIIGQHLTFDGDRFRITLDGKLRYGGQFSLNPDAAPRTIDFNQSETDILAGIWQGIYECMGDKLTICDNAPDMTKPRPAGFDQASAEGYVRVNFTRRR
ncbi:MAG: TIGR03067 domain-containing protein [Hyphomicrobiales bacterium]|nr:TIGR03067 domain-containing protein [Hyphomicrobiales bacterium]MCP4998891.1 TIGR03067 domain-containing protein [Hyphomicrobiales bacterium]